MMTCFWVLSVAVTCLLLQSITTQEMGPPGPPGDTGAAGATGETGYTGWTGATGKKGATGPRGRTGFAGPPGLPGDTGATGHTGPSGLIGVPGHQGWTGWTGATGPVTSETQVDNENDPEFVNCTGPVGPPGPPGMIGPTGATGANGSVGAIGNTGPAGDTGPPGIAYTGPQGIPGVPGPPGAQGATGATGITGSTGIVGPTGVPGATGLPGPRPRKRRSVGCPGPKGPRGATGATGLRGYRGLMAATGVIGPTGATGPAGADGSGQPGSKGPQGPAGEAGQEGLIGATGRTGERGTSGATGATGLPALKNSPVVTGLSPRCGPASGGTAVTVSGTWLNRTRLNAVHFDTFVALSAPGIPSMISFDKMIFTTPRVGSDVTGRPLPVTLEYINQLYADTGAVFRFKADPNVTDIQPRQRLITGGTLLTISGQNLNSSSTRKLLVQVVELSTGGNRLKEVTCSAVSEKMTCPLPPLILPPGYSNISTSRTVNSSTAVASFMDYNGTIGVDVFMELEPDECLPSIDLGALETPLSLTFYPPPVFDIPNDVIQIEPKMTTLTITGKNLTTGCQQSDYVVEVAANVWNIRSLTADRLVVDVPEQRSAYPSGGSRSRRSVDPTCPRGYNITVWIGLFSHVYGCLEFVDETPAESTRNIGLIVGLVVGFGVPVLIILVVIIIVVVVASRRKAAAAAMGTPTRRQSMDTAVAYTNLTYDARQAGYGTGNMDEGGTVRSNVSHSHAHRVHHDADMMTLLATWAVLRLMSKVSRPSALRPPSMMGR